MSKLRLLGFVLFLALALDIMSATPNHTFAQGAGGCAATDPQPTSGFDQLTAYGQDDVGGFEVKVRSGPPLSSTRRVEVVPGPNDLECDPVDMQFIGAGWGYPTQAIVCGVVAVTFGGYGNDTALTGIVGYPNLFITLSGNDEVTLTPGGENHLVLGTGNDVVHQSVGSGNFGVRAFGGTGNDLLIAGSLPSILVGDSGSDALWGFVSRDHLFGGSGDDFLFGHAGVNCAWGGDGEDTIDFSISSGSTAFGGADDDVITGGSGGDLLDGEAGNDTVKGNAGVDTLLGDSGNDCIDSLDGIRDALIAGGLGSDQFRADPTPTPPGNPSTGDGLPDFGAEDTKITTACP
jgi:Ca2+-binding RTX toxin-like protein